MIIYQALNSVTKELNDHLIRRFLLKTQKAAVLNTILNQDGSIPEDCLNKIVVSLINLEHETSIPYNPIYVAKEKKEDGYTRMKDLPFNFNLDVLITAVFESSNYNEGLKFLSEAIYFFQRKNVFTKANTPHLDQNIQELAFELVKLSYHQEHSLWGALGAKYMPSVLFKIRLLSFQNDALEDVPVFRKLVPEKDPDTGKDRPSIYGLKKDKKTIEQI